jgi:hypothetical protein
MGGVSWSCTRSHGTRCTQAQDILQRLDLNGDGFVDFEVPPIARHVLMLPISTIFRSSMLAGLGFDRDTTHGRMQDVARESSKMIQSVDHPAAWGIQPAVQASHPSNHRSAHACSIRT